MSRLCTDVGYINFNKYGEQLCGDHVEVVQYGDDSTVAVLADGLGSGVKANILSTLTAKIISTMIAEEMSIEECVSTIAATLPTCRVRQIAYSTFTIINIDKNLEAEIIQYDNPQVILLRNGKNLEYPSAAIVIDGKKMYKSRIKLQEDDVFIALSDGAVHAGVGLALNLGWQRKHIIKFMEEVYDSSLSAKMLGAILTSKCYSLYDGKPGDDTTTCIVKIRRRTPVNLMFGPPAKPEDVSKMIALFLSKEGKHIVCGGTTSSLVAEFLNKPLKAESIAYADPEVPPTAEIEGVDLVTEGVITMSKVLQYAQGFIGENAEHTEWNYLQDGASRIAKLLFEEATDINFYVGRAVNAAHQNPNLPINFNIKMQLVEKLSACLRKMGKNVKVSYF